MRRRFRRREGQAIVEFALVLPMFLLLVYAITEFGRIWMVQHVLTTASRAGARTGILPSSETSDVTTAVNNYLTAAGLDLALTGTQMSGVGTGTSSGDPTSVTVTYNFSVLSGSMISSLQGTVQLTSTTVMRHE